MLLNAYYHRLVIETKKYKLIINCDPNHEITKKFFSKKIEKNYESYAYTTVIEHKKINTNFTATQVFTRNGPIAFLPISNTSTSIVCSLRKTKDYKKSLDATTTAIDMAEIGDLNSNPKIMPNIP